MALVLLNESNPAWRRLALLRHEQAASTSCRGWLPLVQSFPLRCAVAGMLYLSRNVQTFPRRCAAWASASRPPTLRWWSMPSTRTGVGRSTSVICTRSCAPQGAAARAPSAPNRRLHCIRCANVCLEHDEYVRACACPSVHLCTFAYVRA